MATTDGPRGIDVSHHQASTPSLTGYDFLIARASIGTTPDAMYATHIKNARAKGLVVGAYHFNWSTLSVAAQVKTFLDRAGDVDLYFLDVEYAGNGINAFSRAQATDFIQRVRATGRKCGLYMSESAFYTNVPNDYRWVANWSQPPSMGWTFWQYQGSPLDKNRFNGSLEELRALAGGPDMAQAAITTVTPKLIDVPVGVPLLDIDGKTQLFTNRVDRPGIYSPYGCGTVDGKRRRAFYTDPDGAGDDYNRMILLVLVPDSAIHPIPTPEPPAPAPVEYTVEVGGKPVGSVTLP
jgi:hypothetical protein